MTDTENEPRPFVLEEHVERLGACRAIQRGRAYKRNVREASDQDDVDAVEFVMMVRSGTVQARELFGPHGPADARETLDSVIEQLDAYLQRKRGATE